MMRTSWVGGALIGALVALAGCEALDVSAPGAQTLEFTGSAAQHGQWLEDPIVEVHGRDGRIHIEGRLSGPDPCRTLSGGLQGFGSELVLTVEVRPNGAEACIQPIGQFRYDAVIQNLRPGMYRLRVIHTYPETGWPTVTAFDQQVGVS